MRNLLSILSLLFITTFCSYAQSFERSLTIHFPKNEAKLYSDFRDNEHSLRLLIDSLNTLSCDSTYKIQSITLVGSTSPEGRPSLNKRLAVSRAYSVLNYMSDHITFPDSLYLVESLGPDWSRLIDLVASDPNFPERTLTIELLHDISSDSVLLSSNVDPMSKIQAINDSAVFNYMHDNLFSLIRATYINITFKKNVKYDYSLLEPSEPSMILVEKASPIDTFVVSESIDSISPRRPFYMSIKSNMLYDAVMTPNIGAEFCLGKNFSLSGNWQYAWWKKDKRAFYWRTYGGDLEVRYWFGRRASEKPLTGHHAGLYGQMITYDFEFGGKGVLAPHWSWSIGATYGYSLPIHSVLNIDFAISAGYHQGIYHRYIPVDDEYVWQSTHRRRWFGPTKAEVTLVWLLGYGNHNSNFKANKKKHDKVQSTVETLIGEDKGGEQ